MLDRDVVLPGFPAIDGFSPHCLLGCIEALCRFQFGTDSLADTYYNHTFNYWTPDGGAAQRKNDGEDLDLNFTPILGDQRPQIFADIKALHGIEVIRRDFRLPQEFDEYAAESLARGTAFISFFDFFYLAGRREYHCKHIPHYFCVFAREPSQGRFHTIDQHQGLTYVPMTDFAEMVEWAGPISKCHVFECRRLPASPPPEDRLGRLKDGISSFITNLTSQDRALGLCALDAFMKDIWSLIEREKAAPRVFYMPGIWNYSFQRRHLVQALQSIAARRPELDLARHTELIELLGRLHKQWFDLNHQAEAAISVNRPGVLSRALRGLDAIYEGERCIPRLLERLHEQV